MQHRPFIDAPSNTDGAGCAQVEREIVFEDQYGNRNVLPADEVYAGAQPLGMPLSVAAAAVDHNTLDRS